MWPGSGLPAGTNPKPNEGRTENSDVPLTGLPVFNKNNDLRAKKIAIHSLMRKPKSLHGPILAEFFNGKAASGGMEDDDGLQRLRF